MLHRPAAGDGMDADAILLGVPSFVPTGSGFAKNLFFVELRPLGRTSPPGEQTPGPPHPELSADGSESSVCGGHVDGAISREVMETSSIVSR